MVIFICVKNICVTAAFLLTFSKYKVVQGQRKVGVASFDIAFVAKLHETSQACFKTAQSALIDRPQFPLSSGPHTTLK